MKRRMLMLTVAIAAFLGDTAVAADVTDPENPTCPKTLNWSTYRTMRFTVDQIHGRRILKAEGSIDDSAASRLKSVLEENEPFDEIWLRSPGGNARVGNEAGSMIRQVGLPTRIPPGWACFSACNFMFMGGPIRFIDADGLFVVHMFTHIGDKNAIHAEVSQDADKAAELIGDVEQDSALLASEDNDFLIRMGVSRKLLTEVMYRQKAISSGSGDKSTRRCLTQTEAIKYNVANAQ